MDTKKDEMETKLESIEAQKTEIKAEIKNEPDKDKKISLMERLQELELSLNDIKTAWKHLIEKTKAEEEARAKTKERHEADQTKNKPKEKGYFED